MTCTPCNIPETTLTLSWTYTISGTFCSGSSPLTYNPGSTPTWTGTTLVFGPLHCGVGPCVPPSINTITVQCVSGSVTVSIGCPTQQGCVMGTPYGSNPTSYTCSPFSITWATPPGLYCVGATFVLTG